MGQGANRRAVVDIGGTQTLIEGGSDARYVPTGHIVYAVSGSVFAVAFDVQRLEVKAAPCRWSKASGELREV